MTETIQDESLGHNTAVMSEDHYSPNLLDNSGLDVRDISCSSQPQGYFPSQDLFYQFCRHQPAPPLGPDGTNFNTSMVDRTYQSSATPESEGIEGLDDDASGSLAWPDLHMADWRSEHAFGARFNHFKWDTDTEIPVLAQDELERLNTDDSISPPLLAAVASQKYSERDAVCMIQLRTPLGGGIDWDEFTPPRPNCSRRTLSPENPTNQLAADDLSTLPHYQTLGHPTGEVLHSHREAQDEYLVKSKLSGMSYKEIKAKGQFKEAESTLRGRFRTLTKSKDQRVRKPQWQGRDVSISISWSCESSKQVSDRCFKVQLLRQAVTEFTRVSASGKLDVYEEESGIHAEDSKIPWMKVAQYVALHGSYHFGNATCRRKWDEIKGTM